MTRSPDLHVVLVAPEIPWNTGNVGRTCLALGARLHLIRPLGFRLDARHLKRAGLDYWPHVDLEVWASWEAFEEALTPLAAPWLLSAEGDQTLDEVRFEAPTVLVFGSESAGLPPALRQRWHHRLVTIPMAPGPVRSLNLSTAVAVAGYAVRRQLSTIGTG